MMKRITVSAAHYAQAKHQAYEVKEQLTEHVSPSFDELKKTEFLSIWASALGYSNWSEFQAITNHANTLCTNNLIITPSSLPVLVDYFSKFSPSTPLDLIEFALLKACSKDELQLFDLELTDFIESNTIYLALMPDGYVRRLTDELWQRLSIYPLSIEELKSTILEKAKNERKAKGMSKSEAKACCADIYPKSGTLFETIIAQAEKSNYVRRYHSLSDDTEVVELTEYAKGCYLIEHTHDESTEYMQWIKAVYEKIHALNVHNRPLAYFAKAFYAGISPEDFIKDLTSYNHRDDERVEACNDRIESETGTTLANTETLLYLNPRFFMPHSWYPFDVKRAQVKMHLEQEGRGLDLPGCVLSKPYPNQRYIVSAPKGRKGFFIALSSRSPLKLHLKWSLDVQGGIEIDHTINISLKDFCANKIFSMESTMFNYHDSCTPSSFAHISTIVPVLPDDTQLLYTNHERFKFNKLMVDQRKGSMRISESVTLNAINIGDILYL